MNQILTKEASIELQKLLLDKGIDTPVKTTIAEVIDWIYEKYDIWISIGSLSDSYIVKIYKKNNNMFCSIPPSSNIFELYEKAIEHTLKELI